MATLKKKSQNLETPAIPKQNHENLLPPSTPPINSEAVSGYEQCREKRIKENLKRMKKLGLFYLSSKLNSHIRSSKRSLRRNFHKRTPQSSSLPPRKSSRLQKAPIRYVDNPVNKVKRTRGVRRRRPEIYTEEHEKLLGSYESTWTLFVDGIGANGRRVYDQVKGKTCHQCRQKTLGRRTKCIECDPSVQGQFCGDCLYMRYGENVLEANQNPNWICPPCRGICNCSLCRHAKGWPPTGALYREIANLGYKSVAHYLIQTRRAETTAEPVKVEATEEPVSVKRSLPFANIKEEDLELMSKTEDMKEENLSDDGKESIPKPVVNEINADSVDRRLRQRKNNKSDSSVVDKNELTGLNNSKSEGLGDTSGTGGKEKRERKFGVAVNEPSMDSIGRRLRQRRDSMGT